MKIVLQRVSRASVVVDGETVGTIGKGLLLLIGFGAEDESAQLAGMAQKIARLRVFPDAHGRLHHSVVDVAGAVLAIPQFTLYGATQRGRRPDFTRALEPVAASRLFDEFVDALSAAGITHVARGRFGANMAVSLVNDGPVTLIMGE